MPPTDTPTPADRAALRALLAAITPLPWAVLDRSGANADESDFLGYDVEGPPEAIRGMFTRKADAAYIVVAANALPALLTRLDALEGALRAVEWADSDGVGDLCSLCRQSRDWGHAPDCALATLLGAEGEGGDES